MKTFFNDDSPGKRKAWIRDLEKVLSVARAAEFPRNLSWMDSTAVAELDMRAYVDFAKYARAKERDPKEAKKDYADERKSQFLKVTKTQWTRNKAFGADHLAQTMIHEFSHAALDTQDYVYGDIRNDDLSQLYQLAQGTLGPAGGTKLLQSTVQQLKNGKGEAFDSKSEGGTLAYRNADSFAYATAYLAHSGAKGERQARFQRLKDRVVT
jgi:insecticidal toxin complex protein TccC